MTADKSGWVIGKVLDAQVAARGDARFIQFEDEPALTFREFDARCNIVGNAFSAIGVGLDEPVAVMLNNRLECLWTWIGLSRIGAVHVGINTAYKGAFLTHVLTNTKARFGVVEREYLPWVADIEETAPYLETVYVPGPPLSSDDIPGFARIEVRHFDELMAAPDTVIERHVTYRDTGMIMFTSGTTGVPKGAMLCHEAICRAFLSWSDVIGLTEGDRYLVVNPFFHAFGLNSGILACLMKGVTLVPHLVFDVPSVMRRVAEEQITMLPGPPAIYQTILGHPDTKILDLSSLRLAVTGAATIPVQMIHDMHNRLGFEKVVTGYGLTEASGIATMCRHDDDPELIAGTSGRAIDDVEVRIVDPDGTECPPGTPGEVVVRGYNVMVGYLDAPKQTAEAIDADGWLHTGDIGVMDADGYLDITDRLKDMYINGGFNVYPAEVEQLMLDHPGIAQVAVVGVPDDRMGEVGAAFVVAGPDTGAEGRPEPDEIMSWCRDTMANYKVPRLVVVVDDLPMNASGKVLKFELRDRATALRAT